MPTITFGQFEVGTVVTTQLSAQGVFFPRGAFIDADDEVDDANVLRSSSPTDEFNTGALVLRFTSGQSTVRLRSVPFQGPTTAVARAFDGDGTELAAHGPLSVTTSSETVFELSSSTSDIIEVRLQAASTAFETIRGLEYEGAGPGNLPTEAPSVSIETPSSGAELDVTELTISGRIQGEQLLSVKLTTRFGMPPKSTIPPSTSSVSPTVEGGGASFELTMLAPLGDVAITVSCENVAGLRGEDVVAFSNLPAKLRSHYADMGGEAAVGPLQYAYRTGPSTIAVYTSGALATVADEVIEITGEIFTKWMMLESDFGDPGRLGAPLRAAENLEGGVRKQPFRLGAIYVRANSGNYVPDVFERVIADLGGQDEVGVPISDPTESSGVHRTWLFQQFSRLAHPDLLPSTLEIRGNPPVLAVERQGADLRLYSEIGVRDSIATTWQVFPSEGPHGPCQVEVPEPAPRLQDAGDRFCGGLSWENDLLSTDLPPAWSPIAGDDVMTDAVGVVVQRHDAPADNPLVHEYFSHATPTITSNGTVVAFSSDFNMDLRLPSELEGLLGTERDTLHVEWERYWSRAFMVHPEGGLPVVGDTVFVSGRWIIDCGHPTFKAEIHPPGVVARLFTSTLDDGTACTDARIWVNGYFSGGPVSVPIHPPPRPSPTALLNWVKPVDEDAALGDLSVSERLDPVGTLNAIFSAPHRSNPISKHGMMHMLRDRWYTGRWRVYWS